MSTGGTVEEMDAQVDALVGAVVAHRAVVQDVEQQIIAGRADANAPYVLALHRQIVAEYITKARSSTRSARICWTKLPSP